MTKEQRQEKMRELTQLLEKHGIKVESSAKELASILAEASKVKKDKAIESRLSKLNITKNDIIIRYDDLKSIILSSDSLAFKTITGKNVPHEIVLEILTLEKERKEEAQRDIADSRRREYILSPSEDYAYGDKIVYEDINLFENKFNIKPNQADFELYSCFQNANGSILFKTDNVTRLIFLKNDSSLDMKGELLKTDDKQKFDEDLQNVFAEKYNNYLKILIYILKGLTENDLALRKPDPDDPKSTIGILESIFLSGYDVDGQHYFIPSSFRHFIKLKKKYEIAVNDDGDKVRFYQGLKAFPFNPNILQNLEFDNFLDYFSKNFTKMTRGCIVISKDLKVFSNYASDTSLTYFPKPVDWENAELPQTWKKYFEGKGSNRMLDRVFYYIGMCIDSDNTAQQVLLISDDGKTGKGDLVRALTAILPKGMITAVSNASINEARFTVTSNKLYKAHIIVNTEYDGKCLNSTLMKQITGGDEVTAEIKNGASIVWNTLGTKLIFTSNERSYLNDHAIRRRVIPVSFKQQYDEEKSTPEFMKALISEGPEFLKYCWKRYMKSPFRQKNGSYLVLNEEQAKEYINKKLDLSDYQNIILKAFSKDEELSDKFDISYDFDESGANDTFNELYDTFFEYTDNYNDVICKNDMSTILNKIFLNAKDPNYYSNKLSRFVNVWAQKFSNGTSNNSHTMIQWNAFLEKTKLHKLKRDHYEGNVRMFAYHNIKFKENVKCFSKTDYENENEKQLVTPSVDYDDILGFNNSTEED